MKEERMRMRQGRESRGEGSDFFAASRLRHVAETEQFPVLWTEDGFCPLVVSRRRPLDAAGDINIL